MSLARALYFEWLLFAVATMLSAIVVCGCGDDGTASDTKLSADACMQVGFSEMSRANWPAAIASFEAAFTGAEDNENRAAACFALGHAWQFRISGADLGKSRAYYKRVIADYPSTSSCPWASMALVRMQDIPVRQREFDGNRPVIRSDIRPKYERILKDYPGHKVAHEAALRLAMLDMEQVDDASARQRGAMLLVDYLGSYQDNYLAATMNTVLGYYYQSCDSFSEAVEYLSAAAESGLPTSDDKAREYYRIARIAEDKLGDYSLALKWYSRLVTETPMDNRYYESLLAAKRCRELLGPNTGEVKVAR